MVGKVGRRALTAGAVLCVATLLADTATAQKRDAPGVSDTEIKIGQTLPYSGPASAYGQLGRVEAACFASLNKRGGINGRKVALLSLDDGYSPPKAVEQVRRLVEQDGVAAIFGLLGTPINMAIRRYLNDRHVPQLFVAAGSPNFADPEHFRWTIGWQPTLTAEATFYAAHLLATRPAARVGVLYQYEDFGKGLLDGLKAGLGDKAMSVLTAGILKDASDPQWADDADQKAWRAWMDENMPGADLSDGLNVAGTLFAQTLEQVLRQCGDDLTRENIMRQAANLHDLRLPMSLPGSLINTSPTDYRVITQMRLQRFNGTGWDFVP